MLMTPVKQALRNIKAEMQNITPIAPDRGLRRIFKWLSPGLSIKRWLLISSIGVILTAVGVAIWARLTPIARLLEFISQLLESIATLIPNYISGPLAVILGLTLIFWGQSRTLGSITEVLQPNNDRQLVDVLIAHRRLHRGPKIVAIGGGTGLSTLLRGLKEYSANITAIVTVADDGGSSGRLRREVGGLPPGDIRNCLAALADEEKLLTELFQYRFSAGNGLSGHSFGNLFLSAMSDISGDWERAIADSSQVLAVRGRVFPATLSDVRLWAELSDGRLIEGESNITAAKGKIHSIGCYPSAPPALPAAIKAIEAADYIIIGPGSLYTSIIPNLLVPEIRNAIAARQVPRIYVCNIMTQNGETDGYSVADHIKAIDAVCDRPIFDAVLVNRQPLSELAISRYAREKSHPVFLDREEISKLGRRLVMASVMQEDPETGCIRHDPQRLAKFLLRWYARK